MLEIDRYCIVLGDLIDSDYNSISMYILNDPALLEGENYCLNLKNMLEFVYTLFTVIFVTKMCKYFSFTADNSIKLEIRLPQHESENTVSGLLTPPD